MPTPRAFDHDLLRKLLIEHPADWVNAQFWRALADDNASKDPPVPPPHQRATDRSLQILRRELGIPAGVSVSHEEVAPPEGTLNQDHKNGTIMKRLRELKQQADGHRPDPVDPKDAGVRKARTGALNWECKLRSERVIADLTDEGVPITRPARPEELNAKGELISIMAWKVPGWRGRSNL